MSKILKTKLVECASVPCHLPEDLATKVDALVKELPSDSAYQFRRKVKSDVTEIEPTTRTDVSKISTEDMDRDREIVKAKGFELGDFTSNPIVLFNHDPNKPCGRCVWVKERADTLIAKTEYRAADKDYHGEWLPDQVWQLVKCGILTGKSVGFLPLEIREPDAEELERHPDARLTITRSLLLEYSVVSIPSNPTAVVEAINKGVSLDLLGLTKVGRVAEKPRVKVIRKPPTLPKLDPDRIAREVLKRLKDGYGV